jgi:hypothetical protein
MRTPWRNSSVDRGLAHRDARQRAEATGQTEQRLLAARREVAIIGTAHPEPGQHSRAVAVCEPGAAAGTVPDRIGSDRIGRARARGDQNGLRQSPPFGEVAPGP